MRQTLTNDFWELHKNMNCAFPLKWPWKIKLKSYTRTSHKGSLINSNTTILFCSFVLYVDLSSKMLRTNLVIFWLSLGTFGTDTPLNIYEQFLLKYGVRGWTKFTYSTLHYMIELNNVSAPFLNAELIVWWSVDDIAIYRYREVLRMQISVDDLMQRWWRQH